MMTNHHSHRLEHFWHKPVAFVILPILALANTGVVINSGWTQTLMSNHSFGIIGGVVIGKPLGITLLSLGAVMSGVCRLPIDMNWNTFLVLVSWAASVSRCQYLLRISLSSGNVDVINASKMAILLASLGAGAIGFLWLKLLAKAEASDTDMDTMDFQEADL